jgi:hypothetical protein
MFEQQTTWIGSFNNTNVICRRELDKKKGILAPKEKPKENPEGITISNLRKISY